MGHNAVANGKSKMKEKKQAPKKDKFENDDDEKEIKKENDEQEEEIIKENEQGGKFGEDDDVEEEEEDVDEQDGVSVHSPCKPNRKEQTQIDLEIKLLEALEIYPPAKLRGITLFQF